MSKSLPDTVSPCVSTYSNNRGHKTIFCSNIHHGKTWFVQSYYSKIMVKPYTIWLFNIAMENGPFIDGLPGENPL